MGIMHAIQIMRNQKQPKKDTDSYSPAWSVGVIKYEQAQGALKQGGFTLSQPEMQQLVSQLVDEMDEGGDIQ